MSLILTVDFGSTYTKVVAFDLDREAVVGVSQAGSTVDTDVNIGLQQALDRPEALQDVREMTAHLVLTETVARPP